jgi:cell division septation protein DedD
MPVVSGYANQNGAPPSFQSPSGSTRTYTTPDFPNPFPPQTHQPQPQPHSYQPQPQQRPQAFPGQSYQPHLSAQPSRSAQPSYPPEPGSPRSFQDAGFPERIFPAQEAAPAAGYSGQGFADTNYADASFGDASFPGAGFPDASFPDASFPDPQEFAGMPGHHDAFGEQSHFDDAAAPYVAESDPDSFPDQTGHDYQTGNDYLSHVAHAGQHPLPSHQALQPFDAVYDQPPQIALGRTHYPNQMPPQNAAQDFYESDQGDADFLDENQFMTPGDAESKPRGKFSLRSRSMYMVGSALLGAIALGGALAFAYKQSGGAMGGGQPPVVQADSRPVKEPPQQAGGKEFPHKNKLIYERLQNGDQPEAERIVPRQEELAVPAMPGVAPAQAGTAPMPPPAVATVDDSDGGPRRVKTMVVRPDGSLMTPPDAPAAAPVAAPQQQVAAAAPGAAPQQVAFAQPPMPAPPMPQAAPAPMPAPAAPAPAPKAAAAPVAADPQSVAAIPPAPKPEAAPAKPSQYVVQVGSKQNQTEALATFADMQQKYPTLLANYRPMVQKADLGSKGVWYRLRIGPIVDKSAATKLCGQLKSQGHPDCLVMASQ